MGGSYDDDGGDCDDGDGGDLVETSSFVVEPDGEAGKPVTGAFTPDC